MGSGRGTAAVAGDVDGAVGVARLPQALDDPLDGVEIHQLEQLAELPQVVGGDQLCFEGFSVVHEFFAPFSPA